MNSTYRLGALLAAVALSACSTHGPSSALPAARVMAAPLTSNPIQHIVFIVQENRSFNNLFLGYPGAKTQKYGFDTNGVKVKLHATDLATHWDIGHAARDFFAACDGTGSLPGTKCKMDGWNNEQPGTIRPPPEFAYAYVPRKQIRPYWDIAQQYVLADKMFASNLDASFIAHQYAVAAFASGAVDGPGGPWGCEGTSQDTIVTLTQKRVADGPRIPACFDNPTIGINADNAGVTWRFYAGTIYGDGGLWSSYQADSAVYGGTDWTKDVINPPSQFISRRRRRYARQRHLDHADVRDLRPCRPRGE